MNNTINQFKGAAKAWMGVVSRDHVQIGLSGGFAQLCHGKRGPLASMKAGDWLVYYSPRVSFGGNEMCRSLTAIGRVIDSDVYEYKMSNGRVPYRRDIAYLNAREVPMESVLSQLHLYTENPNWGLLMRRGHFEIDRHDLEVIARAMKADIELAA